MKIKKNEWHLFSLGDEYYLYNCPCKQAVQLDEEQFKLLKQGDSATWEAVESVFSNFPITEEQPLKRNFYDLFLLVSNDCNAQCVYCFADQGCYGKEANLMDSSTARRAIDFFVENIPYNAPANITFFGGEPLLAKNTIKDSIEHIKEKYASRKLTLSITTNGFLLDSATVEYFVANNVNISLSIDGGRVLQQLQRPMKNGGDSFYEVTRMLDDLKKSRLPVIARGTYYDYNVDLAKVYNELLLLHFKEVQIVPDFLHVVDAEEIHKLESQVESLYNYCVYYMKNIMRTYAEFPFVPIVQQMRMLFFAPYAYTYSCERGKTLMAIDCAGDVFACHRLSSYKDSVAANVFEDDVYTWRNEENESVKKTAEKCMHCWNRYTCSHGCAYNSDTLTQKAFCAYSKKMTEVAIAVTSKLSPNELADVIRFYGFSKK